jgi:hypothetical protein
MKNFGNIVRFSDDISFLAPSQKFKKISYAIFARHQRYDIYD